MNNQLQACPLLLALLLTGASASGQDQARMRTELGERADRSTMVRQLSIQPTSNLVQEVSIALPVEFDFGKADLTAKGRDIVDELAEAMNDAALLPHVFIVEGHTDAVGSDQANLGLSKRRAETVQRELISRGVAAVRLQPAGYGELRLLPGVPGTNGRNRRVEVVRRVP